MPVHEADTHRASVPDMVDQSRTIIRRSRQLISDSRALIDRGPHRGMWHDRSSPTTRLTLGKETTSREGGPDAGDHEPGDHEPL